MVSQSDKRLKSHATAQKSLKTELLSLPQFPADELLPHTNFTSPVLSEASSSFLLYLDHATPIQLLVTIYEVVGSKYSSNQTGECESVVLTKLDPVYNTHQRNDTFHICFSPPWPPLSPTCSATNVHSSDVGYARLHGIADHVDWLGTLLGNLICTGHDARGLFRLLAGLKRAALGYCSIGTLPLLLAHFGLHRIFCFTSPSTVNSVLSQSIYNCLSGIPHLLIWYPIVNALAQLSSESSTIPYTMLSELILLGLLSSLVPKVHAAENGMDMSMDGAMQLASGQMLPYLHFTPGDNLWFLGWVPKSAGAMVGTCIGLFLLAVIERWVAASRSVMEIHWAKRAQLAFINKLNKTSRATSTSDAQATEKISLARASTVASIITMRTAPPFIPAHDIPRGILHMVQMTFSFTFMLAVMTFQAAFIIAIIVGLGVGEMLFGRYVHAASHLH